MTRKRPRKGKDTLPSEGVPPPPEAGSPSSSGEHAAVRQMKDALARGLDLAEQIERGEIPRDTTPAPPPDTEPKTPRGNRDAETPRQERILVVDDDVWIVQVLVDALTGEGYHVRWAFNGLEALDKATGPLPPDAILLDVGLPRLSGKAVHAALRADGHCMPILIISAGDRDKLLEQDPALVRKFVFTKPLDLDQLLRELAEMIAEYRALPRLPY